METQVLEKYIGKYVVVTGATGGMGEYLTKRLLQLGVHVIAIGRDEPKLRRALAANEVLPGRMRIILCDVTVPKQVEMSFHSIDKKIGPVYVVFNCAGHTGLGDLVTGDENMWRETLMTNLFGTCIVNKAAIALMRRHAVAGHIINMNCEVGHTIRPLGNMCTISKQGLTAYTEAMRCTLRNMNSDIKISSISPALINTESLFDSNGFEIPLTLPHLRPDDILDALFYELDEPEHVLIQDILMKPFGEVS